MRSGVATASTPAKRAAAKLRDAKPSPQEDGARARWWKVIARRAGPPTVRACCTIAPKSRPPLPASAITAPVTAWCSGVPAPVPRTHSPAA